MSRSRLRRGLPWRQREPERRPRRGRPAVSLGGNLGGGRGRGGADFRPVKGDSGGGRRGHGLLRPGWRWKNRPSHAQPAAAWAGSPMLMIRPDAAAMTAAWRPTLPALEDTALEMAESGLTLTGAALWRPRVLLEDTTEASPNACEVSCRIRMGVTRPFHMHGILPVPCFPASPQGLLAKPVIGSPASARRLLRTDLAVVAELGNPLKDADFFKSRRVLNGTTVSITCHITITARRFHFGLFCDRRLHVGSRKITIRSRVLETTVEGPGRL